MTPARPPTALTVRALCIGLVLAACSAGPPDPRPDAESLAAALSAGEVSSVEFASTDGVDAQEHLEAITADMGVAQPSVTVSDVADAQGASAEPEGSQLVTLAWDWDLDGEGPSTAVWSYSAQAVLRPRPGGDDVGWQVVWDPSMVHPDLDDDSVLSVVREQAPRADILGRGGATLVTARPVERVGIDKMLLAQTADAGADVRRSARQLAVLVGIDPAGFVDRAVSAGDEAFVEAIVLRRADADPLRQAVDTIPGARMLADELPLAPTREFARALLGTVGPATAEAVEASAGAVAATDLVGLSGLAAQYDEQLRGSAGFTVTVTSPDDTPTTLFTTEPEPGTPLTTTLDPVLQQLADDVLADVGPPSALVAMRVRTGELVAVASGPGSEGYSTATLGRYAPGSVFKVVTALALLRAGAAPDDLLPCASAVTVDGKTFTNYSDFPADALGDIPLREALAQSCNTAFVSQVDTLDIDAVTAAAEALGFAEIDGLGFDSFVADVGDPEGRVELAATLIGQGTVLSSPLGVATMAASAVAGAVSPVLLPDAAASSPDVSAVTPQQSEQLTDMMRLAVTDGTATVLADLPAPPVVAKTGTAEYGTSTPPDTHGWMVAVHDGLAVTVFVEQAESGSATAGPILREFLSQRPASSR